MDYGWIDAPLAGQAQDHAAAARR